MKFNPQITQISQTAKEIKKGIMGKKVHGRNPTFQYSSFSIDGLRVPLRPIKFLEIGI
jgi:hypothetical protein